MIFRRTSGGLNEKYYENSKGFLCTLRSYSVLISVSSSRSDFTPFQEFEFQNDIIPHDEPTNDSADDSADGTWRHPSRPRTRKGYYFSVSKKKIKSKKGVKSEKRVKKNPMYAKKRYANKEQALFRQVVSCLNRKYYGDLKGLLCGLRSHNVLISVPRN